MRAQASVASRRASRRAVPRVKRHSVGFHGAAGDLQPAFVHILQQRISYEVGLLGSFNAMEADHDAVQRDLLLHGR